jgi:HEAT repeat protein
MKKQGVTMAERTREDKPAKDPAPADRGNLAQADYSQLSRTLQGAMPLLVAMLREEQAEERARAVAVLTELGMNAEGMVLTVRRALRDAALNDVDETVRSAAISGLANLEPHSPTQIPTLIEALRNEFAPVRMNAAYSLGEMGPEGRTASTALFMALRDADESVRLNAAIALWKIERRDRVVVPVLAQSLKSKDEVLRWMAADCLRDIGPAAQSAVPALKEALKGSFKTVLIKQGLELALSAIEDAQT